MTYGSPTIKKECLNFFNKFVITSKLKDETLLHVGSEFKKVHKQIYNLPTFCR